MGIWKIPSDFFSPTSKRNNVLFLIQEYLLIHPSQLAGCWPQTNHIWKLQQVTTSDKNAEGFDDIAFTFRVEICYWELKGVAHMNCPWWETLRGAVKQNGFLFKRPASELKTVSFPALWVSNWKARCFDDGYTAEIFTICRLSQSALFDTLQLRAHCHSVIEEEESTSTLESNTRIK